MKTREQIYGQDWLPLNVYIRFYLSFFRGIPALVLLFFCYILGYLMN